MSKQSRMATSLLPILLVVAVGVWLPVMPHLMEAGVERFGPGAVDRFKEIDGGFRVFKYVCYFVGFQAILLGIGMHWHRRRLLAANPSSEAADATPESN